MNKHDARKLLQKYRLGQCTPEEKSWVEQWYLEMAKKEFSVDEDIVNHRLHTWKAVQNNIANAGKGKRSLLRRPFLLAACAVLLLGVSFLFYQNRNRASAPDAQLRLYTFLETKNSEVKTFVLPDGSKVWLNAGSKLKYADTFDSSLREVTLEDGEVYFDIKHDTQKPFIVYAGKTKTQVLGTAFTVRSYKSLPQTQITVTRGKVGVMKSGDQNTAAVFLLANQQVTVDRLAEKFAKTNINAQDFMSWTQGKLQINNESLSAIAVILEKKFDTSIQFKDTSLGKLRFSAGFESSEKLDEVLEVLCMAENLAYTRNEKGIILSKRKQN